MMVLTLLTIVEREFTSLTVQGPPGRWSRTSTRIRVCAIHEIFSAVSTVDAMQRQIRAHSAVQATQEYRSTVANGGASQIDDWIWSPIIDTGASSCMTKNKNYLTDYRMLATPIAIGCAGDHVILGIAKGNMKLATGATLKEFYTSLTWLRTSFLRGTFGIT